ncbi:small glutamine-rich tetratricopeptide repeat-containing protein isoform X2 [Senna tora]|uniref:Small glutamine-rich tetratricopeptide repeat-containing protein isoform X2 n=1 Tax=Senna tora TaxID=362788 RepID=A0A834W467_9FABA|nr:small glutamine-rich tetratricopeptide repeat-containing protein isoform X2 [Senna tora]
MMKLKTSSPICVRIVVAFLEFLSFVQGMTNTEIEYLKDLEHALREIFGISDSDMKSKKPKTSLLDMFITRKSKPKADETTDDTTAPTIASSSSGPVVNIRFPNVEEVFHDFYRRLDASRFFDPIFEVGTGTLDLPVLAQVFQTLGFKTFIAKSYYKSIEYSTCAIALFKDNADFFCDRAEALVMIERYQEAMNDCYRAIKLNPKCLRAYMGVGFIYLEQGKGLDAICHGFIKVLQIDPYNTEALGRIEVAKKKVKQQLKWMSVQMAYHRNYGFIPINSYNHKAEEHDEIKLTFQPVPPEEGNRDGGDDDDDDDDMSINGSDDDDDEDYDDSDDEDYDDSDDEDGDDNASEPTWKLEMEDVVDNRNYNQETVADFMDMFGRYINPLE